MFDVEVIVDLVIEADIVQLQGEVSPACSELGVDLDQRGHQITVVVIQVSVITQGAEIVASGIDQPLIGRGVSKQRNAVVVVGSEAGVTTAITAEILLAWNIELANLATVTRFESPRGTGSDLGIP